MKPLGIKNYGSIPHLLGSKLGKTDKYVHQGQHNICTSKTRDKHDLVIVTEKYDGSNVGVAKKDGEIIALTRAGYLADTSPYRQHHQFSAWVNQRADRFNEILREGERYAGEWMAQAHGLRYRITYHDDLCVFFDKFNPDNERVPFDDWANDIYGVGFLLPTLVWHSKGAVPIDMARSALHEMYSESMRCYSLSQPEGLVYRVERNGKVDFLAKWVRPGFEGGKYLPGIGRPEEAKEVWNFNPVIQVI